MSDREEITHYSSPNQTISVKELPITAAPKPNYKCEGITHNSSPKTNYKCEGITHNSSPKPNYISVSHITKTIPTLVPDY